jgi:hypothetical protein
MAFSTVPYALQNSSHPAALFRQAAASLVPNPLGGVVTAGDLNITQTGTPSMAVQIGVGRCWIPGTLVANVTGGNYSPQAMYYAENDSSFTAAIAASNPTNPRIDVVYVAVNDQQYAGTLNGISPTFVATGTPTSGATYPTNAPAVPNNAIALAYVTVAANATSITNAVITQLAPNAFATPFGHMGKTNGFQTISTSATVVMNAAQELVGGVTYNNTNNALVVPVAGRYQVTVCFYTSGGVGYGTGAIMKNGVSTGIVARVQQTSGANDMASSMTGQVPLAAGDQLSIVGGFPFNTYGSTGYNGTYLEAEFQGPV